MTTTASRPAPGGTARPVAPTARPPRPPEARPAPSWPGWLPDLTLALLATVSALAFGRVYRGEGWQGSAVAPPVAAVLVGALTRRLVRSRPLAMLVDALAVLLVVVWTVVPGSTTAGLPLVHTWDTVTRVLGSFGTQFVDSTPPVVPTRAFLLATAAGAGAVGLAASWLRGARRRPARPWAPAPMLALFLAGCVLGGPAGRVVATVFEIVVLGIHLLVEHAAASADPSLWIGGVEAPPLERPGRVGFRILALAAVAAAIAAGLPGPDGRGPFGWKSFGGGGTRIIVSPMVSLSTRLAPHNAKANVFTVTSSVPAYWQLTTLDVYSGGTWQAGRASYRDFQVDLPGSGARSAVPKGTREVHERFRIQALDSPWLPSAFDPVAVRGVHDVQYNPGTGSLLSKHATADGSTYTVTALQTVATLNAADLEHAPPLDPRKLPADSTALPASVPPPVAGLARRIVRHAHTEYARALALQDYFYGPEFTYSLHPPVDGSGIGAIETFLFSTRTGYCQQFAGSYAVLARSIGLPTRLAVGFTTGRKIGPHRYQVTDADVHTWPEVWFPRYGWVPFEPTKGVPGSGFAIPGATAVTGDTSRILATRPHSTGTSPGATTTGPSGVGSPTDGAPHAGGGPSAPSFPRVRPQGHPGGPGAGAGVTGLTPTPTTLPTALGARTAQSNLAWVGRALLVLLAAGAALAVANVAARVTRRRRRRRRLVAAGPGTADAAWLRWEEMTDALATVGIRRKAWESAPRFGARAGWALDPTGRLARELAAAATTVDAVCWGDPAEGGDVTDLAATGAEVRRRVDGRLRWRDRARLVFDVRLAWRPAPVDRDGEEAPAPPEAPRLVALRDAGGVGAGRS